MSRAKKDKGRDPDLMANDSLEAQLVRAFLKMREVDYVKTVVIPVFEAEGFTMIDFHHGQNEVGKDLIFSIDRGFGHKHLAVGVVKPEPLSKSSSDKNGLPVILVQVSQARNNEVISWDGSKRKPDVVYVILADDPSHDIITSDSGGYRKLRSEGVEFILGSEIAKSLLNRRKDIAENLLQTKLDASSYLKVNPTNLPLLHALNCDEIVSLSEIFTDLDATVGSASVSSLFVINPKKINVPISVPATNWNYIKPHIASCQELFGPILSGSIESVEQRYSIADKRAQTLKNKNIFKYIREFPSECASWAMKTNRLFSDHASGVIRLCRPDREASGDLTEFSNSVVYKLKGLRESLTSLFEAASRSRDGVVHDEYECQEILDRLRIVSVAIMDCRKTLPEGKTESFGITNGSEIYLLINELGKDLTRELKNSADIDIKGEKLVSQRKQYVAPARYEVIFDGPAFSNALETYLSSLASRFNSSRVKSDRAFARNVLDDTKLLLSSLGGLLSHEMFEPLFENSGARHSDKFHLGACVLGLLESGADVLLVGAAGSGKSTTLEVFAKNAYSTKSDEEEVIFLPLAKTSSPPDEAIKDVKGFFFDEVARLLKTAQGGISAKLVSDSVERAQRVVLVLDGIDEAPHSVRWLIQLIDQLREEKGDGLQIVASSRFSDSGLESIGLMHIKLLPFRREQVERFIVSFLASETSLAAEVIQHLNRNPSMFSVVQTPLMATILCVLARNGVVLPETKIALYKERFELLWGAYDAKKQIRRVKSSRACLEDVSRKIAYFLHVRGVRSASRDVIREYVQNVLTRKYHADKIDLALTELERPCNVLFEDYDDRIGLGHLSYQEYLTAEELYANQQSEIAPRLSDPWWRGVLVLAAMKCDDIGAVIERRISDAGVVGDARQTLSAMIEVCGDRQKKYLRELLVSQTKLDDMLFLSDLDE